MFKCLNPTVLKIVRLRDSHTHTDTQTDTAFYSLGCLKLHMAVAQLISNKIRVMCNCWSHLDS